MKIVKFFSRHIIIPCLFMSDRMLRIIFVYAMN